MRGNERSNERRIKEMIQATEARSRAQQLLYLAGVKHAPIDVSALAEILGFDVIPFPFPPNIHGVTFIEGEVRAIGVNKDQPKTRRRFSIAHEIGHFLSGHISFDDGDLHVEDSLAWFDSYNQQEREANEFAAELLMPESFLREDADPGALDVPRLARKYEVSEQALWIQLMDLKLASQHARA